MRRKRKNPVMILAGVDEAGLGPTLGPLITASAALSVPDDWSPDAPWEHLAGTVERKFRRGANRPVVADSKELHRDGGVAALELTAGVFSLLANGDPRPRLTFSENGDAARHPCYAEADSAFPRHAENAALPATAAGVADAMKKAGAQAGHYEARALAEPVLNRRFTEGMNKNQALLVETGWHIRALAAKFPEQPMIIVVDKQGGRNDYLPFLSALFPGIWLDTLECGADVSSYRLRRERGPLEIRFLAKADRLAFPTALASAAAKYAREGAMDALNRWFCQRLPGLKPTAGYPQDAKRWLAAMAEWDREQHGDPRLDLLLRQR